MWAPSPLRAAPARRVATSYPSRFRSVPSHRVPTLRPLCPICVSLYLCICVWCSACLHVAASLGLCRPHVAGVPCLRLSMDPFPPTGSGAPSDADNLVSRSDLIISPRCAAPSARRSDDNLDDNKLHGFHLPILLRFLQSPTHATQSDGKSETGSELSCLDTVYYR